MTLAAHAQSLIGYHQWANEKILEQASRLGDDDLGRDLPVTHTSIRAVLVHMLGTMTFWHANWTHTERREPDVSTHALLVEAYAAAHTDLRAFAERLTDADWARSEPWWQQATGHSEELPLGDTIVQVVNHGTQHRSEIAVMLTELGCSPGDLDYLNYAFRKR